MVERSSISEALNRLRDPEWIGSDNWTDQRKRVALTYHHPHLVEFVRVVSHRMRKLHVPLYVERVADPWINEPGVTVDQVLPQSVGCAVDLVHGRRGYNLTKKEWAVIAHIAEQVISALSLDVCQGGRPAEWQVVGWKAVAKDFPRWTAYWDAEEVRRLVVAEKRRRSPRVRG